MNPSPHTISWKNPAGRAPKISYGLDLEDDEEIVGVYYPQGTGQESPSTSAKNARRTKRTVRNRAGVSVRQLPHLLGIDLKGKPERTHECFEACKALHLDTFRCGYRRRSAVTV